jgi:hypothetical protein
VSIANASLEIENGKMQIVKTAARMPLKFKNGNLR